MIGGTLFGIHGILLTFIFMIINLSSYDFLGMPYLVPFAPPIIANLRNSIIKSKTINLKKKKSHINQ